MSASGFSTLYIFQLWQMPIWKSTVPLFWKVHRRVKIIETFYESVSVIVTSEISPTPPTKQQNCSLGRRVGVVGAQFYPGLFYPPKLRRPYPLIWARLKISPRHRKEGVDGLPKISNKFYLSLGIQPGSYQLIISDDILRHIINCFFFFFLFFPVIKTKKNCQNPDHYQYFIIWLHYVGDCWDAMLSHS